MNSSTEKNLEYQLALNESRVAYALNIREREKIKKETIPTPERVDILEIHTDKSKDLEGKVDE